MEKGTYRRVRVRETTVDELKPYINTFGRLIVAPKNEIVFDVAQKSFKYKVLLSHNDFIIPACSEIWVGVNEGDITFDRIVQF